MNQLFIKWINCSFNESIVHSMNQLFIQWINCSLNESISCLYNELINCLFAFSQPCITNFSNNNNNNNNNNNIPWLSTPRRGSHVKSDKTRTHSHQDTLFAHILDSWALIFSSWPFLQFIPTTPWEGGPKEHRAKQKWPSETHSIAYVTGLSTLSGLSLSRSLHRHSSVA